MKSLQPEVARITLPRAAALTVASVLVAVALSTLYDLPLPWDDRWIRAATIHTVFGLVVIVLGLRAKRLDTIMRPGPPLAYGPALGVILGSTVLALGSRMFIADPPDAIWGTHLAWVLWIPIVEELVFRGGVLPAYRLWAGDVWGVWLSAVTFALVHGGPTLTRLAAGEVGVPIGPLLLGIATAALVVRTQRLLPAVALHVACNATPLIFGALDARWLAWLGVFYQ